MTGAEPEDEHDAWIAKVLHDLRWKSANAPIWDGELSLGKPISPGQREPSDPQAARVLTQLFGDGPHGGSKSSKGSLSSSGRPLSVHTGLCRAVSQNDAEPGAFRRQAEAAAAGVRLVRPPTSEARRQTLAEFAGVTVEDLGPSMLGSVADVSRLLRLDADQLAKRALNGDLEKLAEALSAVEPGQEQLPHMAWIRHCAPPWDERGGYPLITEQLDDDLPAALAGCFDKDELETLFDMFDHYAIELDAKVVVLERELCDCLYWVNVRPNPLFLSFCQTVVKKHAQDGFISDETGERGYSLSNFLRWMLHYRLRYHEEFSRKAGFTDKAVAFMRSQFAPFDTEGKGLKTKQVFELLGALSHRPQSVDDQKRTIQYINEVDLDKSGTIDFGEFVPIMRLLMEHYVTQQRDHERDVFANSGFLPVEVDGLWQAFQAFDPSGSGELTLQSFRRFLQSFKVMPQRGDIHEMVKVMCGRDKERDKEQERVIRFVDFVGGMRHFVEHDTCGLAGVLPQMLAKPILKQWVRCASPSPDELRGRWELAMAERHQNRFLRVMLKADFEPLPSEQYGTPAPAKLKQPTSKDKRSTSHRVDCSQIAWCLLEGDPQAEWHDPDEEEEDED